MTPTLTLSDVHLPIARCSGCSVELPSSAPIDKYKTSASAWVVVLCPHCKHATPFRLEDE